MSQSLLHQRILSYVKALGLEGGKVVKSQSLLHQRILSYRSSTIRSRSTSSASQSLLHQRILSYAAGMVTIETGTAQSLNRFFISEYSLTFSQSGPQQVSVSSL